MIAASWPANGEVPMPSRAEIRRQVIDALSRIEESEADAEEVAEEVIYLEPGDEPWRIGYFKETTGGAGA
jgi:hypothetical protein